MGTAGYKVRTTRPRIRRGMPQASGLVGAWAWPGGYGSDMIGTCQLAPTGVPGYDPVRGLISAAAAAGYVATAPPQLRLSYPFSIVWSGQTLGGATPSSVYFGIMHSNFPAAPYCSNVLVQGPPGLQYQYNDGANFQQINPAAPPIGPRYWMAAVCSSGSQVFYANAGADGIGGGAPGTQTTSPAYGTAPKICFAGDPGAQGRNTSCTHDYGYIYNRALSRRELIWLLNNGSDLYARKRDWTGWTAALGAAGVSGVSISPAGLRITDALGVAATKGGAALAPVGLSIIDSLGAAAAAGAASIAPAGLGITEVVGAATAGTGVLVVPSGLVITDRLGVAAAAGTGGALISPAALVITTATGSSFVGRRLVTPASGFVSVVTAADSFLTTHPSNQTGADSFFAMHTSQVAQADSFDGPHTSNTIAPADSFQGPHTSVKRET